MKRTFLFWNNMNRAVFYKVMDGAKAIDQKTLKTHEDKAPFFSKKERDENQNRATSEDKRKKAFDDDIACSQ